MLSLAFSHLTTVIASWSRSHLGCIYFDQIDHISIYSIEFFTILNTAVFIKILRWRKGTSPHTHTVSLSSAEDSVLQGVKQKGSAFTFLRIILPTSAFAKCHLSQEIDVELRLKIKAAIKSDPSKQQTSSVNWSEMSFFHVCTCSHTYKHTHTCTECMAAVFPGDITAATQFISSLPDSIRSVRATIYSLSIHTLLS